MANIEPIHYKLYDGRSLTFRALALEDAATHAEFRKLIPQESTHTLQHVRMEVPALEFLAERHREALNDSKTLMCGVFDGDRMVGYLRTGPNIPGHPWVEHLLQFGMMVLKEFWGHGIGKRLLQIQDDFAINLGVTRIEAYVRTKNQSGVRLYLRHGFQIEGTRREAAIIDGEVQDEFYIAKLLNDPLANWKPPIIETDRLILRPLELSDAAAIFEYTQVPVVSEYTLWDAHQSIDDSVNFIKDYAFPFYSKGVPEPFGITLKSHPAKVIGTVGAFWASRPAKSMELGYALSNKYWGQGLMPEAARAVMKFCLREYELKRIQARCIEQNVSSATVMKKIGMTYEGTLRAQIYRRDKYWDMAHYALIVE